MTGNPSFFAYQPNYPNRLAFFILFSTGAQAQDFDDIEAFPESCKILPTIGETGKTGDIKTLSYEEVDAIANAAVALVNEKYDLQTVCSENEALFEQYIENAEFKDEFFPSDASYFTLSDGSKAYYLPCNAFIHHRNDGSASLVTAPCAGVVVEVNGINPLLNASNYYTGTTNHNGDVHSLTSPCVVAGRYLDGLGFDPDYPTYVGGSMEDFRYGYAELLKEITCREDAVYVIASEFWGYTGTVEVLI